MSEENVKPCCIACHEVLKTEVVSNILSFGATKQSYCTNRDCARYGLITVVALLMEKPYVNKEDQHP